MSDKNVYFFDMDGLIFDTEQLYYETRRKVLADYGIDFTLEDYLPYMGKGYPDTIQRLAALMDNQQLGEKVYSDAMDLYHWECENGGLAIKEGVVDFLQLLKNNSNRTYVTSSSDYEVIVHLLKEAHLTHYFNDVLGGNQVAKAKPAPDIYLKALEVFDAAREETVVFEDSKAGVISAYEAGIDVVMIPSFIRPDSVTRSKTILVTESLSDVKL